MKIQIINGPNLNLLGKREPTIYGNNSFESYLELLRAQYPQIEISYFQSNIEGEMINKIHGIPFIFWGRSGLNKFFIVFHLCIGYELFDTLFVLFLANKQYIA